MARKTLGDVADYINGRAFKPIEWETTGKPIIRIQNLTNSSTEINRTTKTFEEKYSVRAGDLLFAWSASLGAYIWNGEDGWLNQHIFKVIPKKDISKKYLYYYLLHVVDQLYAKAHGSGMVHITIKPFKATTIPLPPLPEQQRIVDRIESLFAKLDEAKQKAQDALDSFETRKAAILHKAFTGELTAQWRKEHGVGMESWARHPLKDVTQIGSGGTPSRKNSQYYLGDILWVKTGEIYWNYIYDSEEKITEEAIANSSAKLYPAGTVLVAMYGQGLTRGRSAILGVPATTNQAVCALQPCDRLGNRYLYYYFMANYWEYREKAVGGNQPNYSATMIGKWIINIPSVLEQAEIVRILDDLLAKEQQAKEVAEAVLEQIDLIKKSILARAFRGELGTNDPAEESAVELVRNII
jgi:type I restriction modification DNA specificity domain protein